MLTQTLATEHPEIPSSHHRAATGRASGHAQLRLRMDFTDPDLAVLTIAGDLDGTSTSRLAELLWPRLLTKLTALVLDLHEVSFLGVDALRLLVHAHRYATHRDINLCLINGTPTVDRALAAAGLDTVLPCFTSVNSARACLGAPVDAPAAIPSPRGHGSPARRGPLPGEQRMAHHGQADQGGRLRFLRSLRAELTVMAAARARALRVRHHDR
ncbi:STAS domain-containing protein [Saccharopolyspora tripterygii]